MRWAWLYRVCVWFGDLGLVCDGDSGRRLDDHRFLLLCYNMVLPGCAKFVVVTIISYRRRDICSTFIGSAVLPVPASVYITIGCRAIVITVPQTTYIRLSLLYYPLSIRCVHYTVTTTLHLAVLRARVFAVVYLNAVSICSAIITYRLRTCVAACALRVPLLFIAFVNMARNDDAQRLRRRYVPILLSVYALAQRMVIF